MSFRVLVVVATCAALAGGCAPTMRVVSYEPGIIEPRGARRLVVADGEGRREERAIVNKMLVEHLRGSWFLVGNASDDGVKIVINGKRADVLPEDASIDSDDLWVKADVVDWDVDTREVTSDEDADEDGQPDTYTATTAAVSLLLSVVSKDGTILLREREFRGDVEAPAEDNRDPSDMLVEAAQAAVSGAVDQLQPHHVSSVVRIDDSDPGQKAIVEGMKSGGLGGVKKALRHYLKKNPRNAIAHYNLAVTEDATGDFDDALDEYDRAIELQARDYYFQSRESCAKRVQAHDALYGARPKREKKAPTAPKPRDGKKDDDTKSRNPRVKGQATPEGTAPPAP